MQKLVAVTFQMYHIAVAFHIWQGEFFSTKLLLINWSAFSTCNALILLGNVESNGDVGFLLAVTDKN